MKLLTILTTLAAIFALTLHSPQPALAGFEMDGEGNVEEKR